MNQQLQYGFWPFVLPFVAFMVLSMLEPSFPTQEQDVLSVSAENETLGRDLTESEIASEEYVRDQRRKLANKFFLMYGIKVLVVSGLLIYFAKFYLAPFPISCTWLSVVVGTVGVVVWILLCQTGLESSLLAMFSGEESGETGIRSQFNPFAQLPEAWQLYGFLALRFFGLAVMVPICEELFLRGFLMRYFESPDWWTINLGRLSVRAMLIAPVYGAMTHPTEALAAIAWFSMVTWLVHHTGKFWDAVVAHAVTNFLLGLYVCVYSQWQLW